jgi:hypothetical protein
MSKADKILDKVMSGRSDANVRFDDLCHLLLMLGFIERRTDGSHAIFQDGSRFVNLQNIGGMVKKYQVRRVREILRTR